MICFKLTSFSVPVYKCVFLSGLVIVSPPVTWLITLESMTKGREPEEGLQRIGKLACFTNLSVEFMELI